MYSKEFKINVCKEYVNSNMTRREIAKKYNIPFETFKNWMKKYYAIDKNDNISTKIYHKTIEKSDYNSMTPDELKLELIKKDIEIERLKKKYSVNLKPSGEKEYIIYSDKNTQS